MKLFIILIALLCTAPAVGGDMMPDGTILYPSIEDYYREKGLRQLDQGYRYPEFEAYYPEERPSIPYDDNRIYYPYGRSWHVQECPPCPEQGKPTWEITTVRMDKVQKYTREGWEVVWEWQPARVDEIYLRRRVRP